MAFEPQSVGHQGFGLSCRFRVRVQDAHGSVHTPASKQSTSNKGNVDAS